MEKKFRKLLIFVICILSLSKITFAYLDPGTGGAIIGSLWPLIVVFFATVGAFLTKRFWNPIKNTFSNIFGKND